MGIRSIERGRSTQSSTIRGAFCSIHKQFCEGIHYSWTSRKRGKQEAECMRQPIDHKRKFQTEK